MNATSISELRGVAGRAFPDEKMDQIRELLVGDSIRLFEARLAHLEARVNDLEVGISRQLDAVEARIEAFAGSNDGERRANFEALARSVNELGEQIRRISRG